MRLNPAQENCPDLGGLWAYIRLFCWTDQAWSTPSVDQAWSTLGVDQMLNRKQKEEIATDLSDKFKRAKIAFFSDFHGIAVSKAQALRRLLKKDAAEYRVAKKTLLDRALEKAGIGIKTKELQGEISVTFGYGDEVLPAKTLTKFSKANETFKVLAGILGDRVLDAKDVIALAKLPSREVLLAQVVSAMQTPIRGLVNVLQGNIRGLVVVINKISAKGGSASGGKD